MATRKARPWGMPHARKYVLVATSLISGTSKYTLNLTQARDLWTELEYDYRYSSVAVYSLEGELYIERNGTDAAKLAA